MRQRIVQIGVILIALAIGTLLVGRFGNHASNREEQSANGVMRNPSEFLWSDAWLLTAIFWAQRAEGQVSLMKIVAYGDLVNVAIFNPEELESGLARLTEGGLIKENAGLFSPAGMATAWYSEFTALNQNNLESMEWMKAKLHSEPYRGGRDARNNRHYPGFTKARFDEAVARYRIWFKEQQAQITNSQKSGSLSPSH
jgi:hypothetical protein